MLKQSSVLKGISATLLVGACCSSFLPLSIYLGLAGLGSLVLSDLSADS
jgi:hypothetical protein